MSVTTSQKKATLGMTNTPEKPRNVKNFGLAFLILSLLMVASQLLNFIITLLPLAEDAVIQLEDGTILGVTALRDTYLTLVILIVVFYGLTWFWVRRSKSWARWVAILLALIAALIGVQGLAQAVATGFSDMIGSAVSTAQVLAAGWVLALAFRTDVHQWYKTQGRPQ